MLAKHGGAPIQLQLACINKNFIIQLFTTPFEGQLDPENIMRTLKSRVYYEHSEIHRS